MNQRMTEHEFAARFGGIGMDDWSQELAREAARSRSEEARLLEESRELSEEVDRLKEVLLGKERGVVFVTSPEEHEHQEATIKALADALEAYAPDGDAVGCGCCSTETARNAAEAARLAALRLAGRLK